MSRGNEISVAGVVWDVHAHYLPEAAIELMGRGQVHVTTTVVDGIADSITVNGMAVGATTQQLSDVDGIIAATDRAGIDRRVLSPPPFTYRYWDDVENSLALARLLNDATATVVESHSDRFVGLATVPLQDSTAAIAEANRARDELGLVGVTVGTNVAGNNVSDEAGVPFLADLADRDIPLLVHPDFVPNPRIGDYYLVNLLGLPVESAVTMSNMIFSGLFDRYSDLRVCFMHGGGVAPYVFGRWDKGWKVRPESKRDMEREPTDYLGNIFCDTLTHSPAALSYLVEAIGERNVVIGTDLPFDVEDPDPRAHIRQAARLTDDQIEVIETVSPVRWLTGDDPS
ncbi:MAG: amidohydrolase family protein [Acidimicrobiia bacterium]|nr:amidohydrolase family protein [Acidimicrobiia bacterium]